MRCGWAVRRWGLIRCNSRKKTKPPWVIDRLFMYYPLPSSFVTEKSRASFWLFVLAHSSATQRPSTRNTPSSSASRFRPRLQPNTFKTSRYMPQRKVKAHRGLPRPCSACCLNCLVNALVSRRKSVRERINSIHHLRHRCPSKKCGTNWSLMDWGVKRGDALWI